MCLNRQRFWLRWLHQRPKSMPVLARKPTAVFYSEDASAEYDQRFWKASGDSAQSLVRPAAARNAAAIARRGLRVSNRVEVSRSTITTLLSVFRSYVARSVGRRARSSTHAAKAIMWSGGWSAPIRTMPASGLTCPELQPTRVRTIECVPSAAVPLRPESLGASAAVVIVARTSWMSAGSGSAAVRVWFPARMVTVR